VLLLSAHRYNNPIYDGVDIMSFYNVDFLPVIIKLPSLDLYKYRVSKFTTYIRNTIFFIFSFFFLLFHTSQNKSIFKVIYFRTVFDLILFILTKPFLRQKMIYEIHDIPPLNHIFSNLIIQSLRRCDAIITISNFQKRILTNMGLPAKQMHVVPDGFDSLHFKAISRKSKTYYRKKYGFEDDVKILLYSGQLSKWKNPLLIIQAVKILSNKIKHKYVMLFLGGNESDISRLRKQSEHLNIQFRGFVPPSEVPSFLHIADVLIHNSPGTGKPGLMSFSPLKIFEYMAVAIPIVAPRQPAIEEIITDGNEGLLFSPDDANDLSEKIMILLTNKKLSDTLSKNAKQKAYLNFTYEQRAKKIHDIIYNLYADNKL